MFCRDEIWSRFVRELTIWPTKEVTMVCRTQPSGPLCLWQCLIDTYQISCHKALAWSPVWKQSITKYSQVPVLLHLSGCQLRLQHQLHLWRTLLVRKYFQRWLKVTKYPTIWSPKLAKSHQKSRHFIFSKSPISSKSQQYDYYQEDDLDLRPDLPRPLCQRCWSLIPTKDLIWH